MPVHKTSRFSLENASKKKNKNKDSMEKQVSSPVLDVDTDQSSDISSDGEEDFGPSPSSHKQASNPAAMQGRPSISASEVKKYYKSVLVYDKPKKDQTIKKVESRLQGIWASKMQQQSNPSELWFFDKGEEPNHLKGSNHTYGYWGFRPGLNGDFDDFLPEDLWVFPPLAAIPDNFEIRGVWIYPTVKVHVGQLAPGESGFLEVCKSTKSKKLDIGGVWRIYFHKGEYRDDRPRLPESIIQIKVKTGGDKYDTIFPLKPTDTIADVKEKVLSKHTDEPKNRSLIFRGEPLDDHETLENCNISHGSILELEHTKLFVEDWDKHILEIRATTDDTIQYVKEEISKMNGIPPEFLRLSFEKALLSKHDGTIQRYGISNKDTIKLEPLQLRVKQPDCKDPLVVAVRPCDLISDVKKRIAQRGGIPAKAQRLSWNGKELKDGKSLTHYNIQHGSILELAGHAASASVMPESPIKPAKKEIAFKIYITTPDGRALIDADPFLTIGMLKKIVEAKFLIPYDVQFIIHNGSNIQDDCATLSSLGVKHKELLEVQVNDPGFSTIEMSEWNDSLTYEPKPKDKQKRRSSSRKSKAK